MNKLVFFFKLYFYGGRYQQQTDTNVSFNNPTNNNANVIFPIIYSRERKNKKEFEE